MKPVNISVISFFNILKYSTFVLGVGWGYGLLNTFRTFYNLKQKKVFLLQQIIKLLNMVANLTKMLPVSI